MERFDVIIGHLALALSRALEPVASALSQAAAVIRRQMDLFGVPFEWQERLLLTAAAVAVILVLRALPGALRFLGILFVVSMLAKMYGLLPYA